MDTTPIVARLNAIADAVKALKELQPLPYDEFAREHVLHGSAERDFQGIISVTAWIESDRDGQRAKRAKSQSPP